LIDIAVLEFGQSFEAFSKGRIVKFGEGGVGISIEVELATADLDIQVDDEIA